MIEIETLTPQHASDLNNLLRMALKDYPTVFATDFSTIKNRSAQAVVEHLSDLEKTNGFRLGAFDERGALVGTIRLEPRRGPKLSHCADVMMMFVRPDSQNQGIGQQLLETAIERAKGIDGLEQLELSASRDASAAIRLYEKVGFESTGVLRRQIRVDNDYYDCVAMWMSLQ